MMTLSWLLHLFIIWKSPVIGAHGASGVSAATKLGALEKDARVSVIAPLVSPDIIVSGELTQFFRVARFIMYSSVL